MGGARRPRRPRAAVGAAMIVYGRNPVREAIRGPRQVQRAWATKNAARAAWLIETAVPVSIAGAEEIQQRCGSTAHQGLCASVSPFRYASAEQLLAVPEGVIVVLD